MNDQVSNLGSSFTDDPVIFSQEAKARVDLTLGNQHSITYIPLRPPRRPKSLQVAQTETKKRPIDADEGDSENVKGLTAQDAANKDGDVKETPVTPSEPKTKRARKTKFTVICAASSQKDVDITGKKTHLWVPLLNKRHLLKLDSRPRHLVQSLHKLRYTLLRSLLLKKLT